MVTLTTVAKVKIKAGNNFPSSIGDSDIETFIEEAEAYISTVSREDWVNLHTNLKNYAKRMLSEATSNLAAIYVITWDMSTYTTRIEAEDMLNILKVRFNECMERLGEQKVVTFMKEGI